MNILLAPIIDILGMIGGVGQLITQTLRLAPKALMGTQGRRLGWRNLWAQMDRVGVRSIAIICLVMSCIGAILSLQMAPVLAEYGQVSRVADIIAIAVARELGPLVTAIVLTGFAGASIAAEMGTMVVSEEVEALESHAIDPIRFLVVPRIMATTIMMVYLAAIGDLAGALGGMSLSWAVLKIDPNIYVQHTFDILKVRDFVTGLAKAGVFGAIISGMACHLGLTVKGGALGVGTATTRTVVLTIVALIIVDLLFTAVFYFLKL